MITFSKLFERFSNIGILSLIFEPPSIAVELFRGMDQFVHGEYGAGSKHIIKNLPYMRLWFIKDMVNELGNVLVDIDDDGLEKTLRARY